MEKLIEVPKTKWSDLRDLYRKDWPKYADAFCLLDSYIEHPDFIEAYNFKVYSPDGDLSNGMVAVIDQQDYELMIHPLNNKIMEEALASTKVIDWSRNIDVASASPDVEECLKRTKPDLEITGGNCFVHLLHNSSPQFEIRAPTNTYVDQLKPEHLTQIDKTWTFYSKNSHKLFELLMRNNLTYVLYSENHKPLAWITVEMSGALCHLYCLEDYRRKGYAEFILKSAINDLLSKGKHVLAYTLEKNVKPQMLFDKLKFDKIGCVKWLHIQSKKNNS